MAPGSLQGLQLCVADIEAAHALLAGRGVAVSAVRHHDGTGFVDGKGDDWNSFFFFSDPDGNGWAVQESPTMRQAAGILRPLGPVAVTRRAACSGRWQARHSRRPGTVPVSSPASPAWCDSSTWRRPGR